MAMDPSIQAAITFLLSARDSEGWWHDFEAAGPSDDWVTAYVGVALAAVPDAHASQAVHATWHLLRRRRWWSGGWGYNRRTPADADSTVWTLHLAEAVGAGRSFRAHRAHRFLTRHIRPCGGIATYAEEEPIRRFTRLPEGISLRGWCAVHACVTAAAAALTEFPARRQLLDYLRRTQSQDGGWNGYWWYDDEYTTALAAEALASDPQFNDTRYVQLAAKWVYDRMSRTGYVSSPAEPHGSVFATAWSLRTLVLANDLQNVRELLDRAIKWLLQHQGSDGSWPPSARLWVPPPDVVNPESLRRAAFDGKVEGNVGAILLDQQAIFTTATVLKALQTVRSRISQKGNATN